MGSAGGCRRAAAPSALARGAPLCPEVGLYPAGKKRGLASPQEWVSRFPSYICDLSSVASTLQRELCACAAGLARWLPTRRCHREPSLAWALPGHNRHTPYRRSQPLKLLHTFVHVVCGNFCKAAHVIKKTPISYQVPVTHLLSMFSVSGFITDT